jgi:hypothetical protein
LYSTNIDAVKRKKTLLQLGAGAVLLFTIIRFINIYGDPAPWSKQHSFIYSLLSFINVTKYPPSLLYALMTIGPGLIFLSMAEKAPGRAGKFFLVFGRTAMFYYILHVFLIHILATFATTLCGHQWTDMIWDNLLANDKLVGYGFSLPVVYLVWIIVIAILYPLCKWYDKYKTNHKEKWWLSYL